MQDVNLKSNVQQLSFKYFVKSFSMPELLSKNIIDEKTLFRGILGVNELTRLRFVGSWLMLMGH